MIVIRFEAIGTQWEIEIYDELPLVTIAELKTSIKNRIEKFDRTYSRFRKDAVLMQLAQKPGTYKLPDDAKLLFDLYRSLYRITEGKVTPLVGNLMVEAGYDKEYSLRPKSHLHAVPKWEDVLVYDFPYVTTSQPVTLDVGAAGKGYITDIIGRLLSVRGIKNFLIDASGDILHHSEKKEKRRVGLENPNDSSQVIGVVEIGNESICGSATNRRKWAGLHHIMDPVLARPVQDIIATWVVAENALLADGLATALFFTSAENLQKKFQFDYLLVRRDMTILYSTGLRGEIFQ